MGNKVHPKAFRTGVIYSWESKWFAPKRTFAATLREDTKLKTFLRAKLKEAAVDRIEIDRSPRALTVTVHTAKPGLIIGRGGTGVEDLKKQLRDMVTKGKPQSKDNKLNLNLNIVEIANPSLSAAVVVQSMIADTEKRLPFRRVLKTHLERVQKAGAKGVKLEMKGRLNGAEIARDEKLSWGSVPLHNLRADIDYASDFARTIFGTIGMKCWIYRGEVFEKDAFSGQQAVAAPAPAARPIPRPLRPAAPRAGARPIARPVAKPAAAPATEQKAAPADEAKA